MNKFILTNKLKLFNSKKFDLFWVEERPWAYVIFANIFPQNNETPISIAEFDTKEECKSFLYEIMEWLNED